MEKSNLLIVDDSPYMHKMIRAYLEPDPLVLHSAYDGESALKQVVEIKPSLILMDIDMPEMDGLEVCRRLKASPVGMHTPIIFLTADCSLNDKVKALDMGAVDYITKPFKPDELRARVRSALRARQHLQQVQMVDSASGLWNEAYLNMQLPAFLSLSRRSRQPLSCIVARLDNFAALRKKHTTDFEENIIKSTANVFLSETRTEDLVCHCGEGRFVALIPSTTRAGAAKLADRIRAEIEKQLFFFDKGPVTVTCSFGVSDNSTTGNLSLIDSAAEVIARASSSGNTVMIAAPFTDAKSLAA